MPNVKKFPPFLQATDFFVITPSDSDEVKDDAGNDTGYQLCALFIGTGGDVSVVPVDSDTGDAVVFKNIPDGTFMPILVKQVTDTGTDADDIIGLVGMSTGGN